ncbi:MAG: MmcQ/YjbR family DNA-binding protein [Microthrixaceae bacterium]
MAHPQMFDDDDPLLARVRELATVFPGTDEKVSHGRPAFFTKKVFAYYGGSVKVDSEYVQHPHCIVILADTDEKRALLELDYVYPPAYMAPSGWIGVDIDDSTDWSEIAELLDASYRLTAPKRLIEELDGCASG